MLTIVIISHHRPLCLKKTLENIIKTTDTFSKKLGLEIIVVYTEDKETEKILKDLINARENIVMRTVPVKHPGASYKRNRGVALTKGEIVILLDDDIIISPETFERVINHLTRDEKIATVTFPVHSDNPSFSEKLHHWRFIGITTSHISTVMPVTAFRRDIFLKIGGYREDMGPPYSLHEDWELGSRIRKHGYKIIVDGTLPQRHLLDCPEESHNTGKVEITSSGRSRIKALLMGAWRYARSYIDKHWWSFWQVMKSSPLSQLVEYAGYYALPVILLSALLTAGIKGLLLSLGIVVAIIDTYSLLMRYYSRLSLLERLTYPLVLVAVRSIRAYLALIGLIHNKLRGREPRQRK